MMSPLEFMQRLAALLHSQLRGGDMGRSATVKDRFYEDSFVKPLLMTAFMCCTSWAPHEGMWGTWHGATRSSAAS